MQADLIEKIKAAEAQADEIVKAAAAQAREIISAANKEAYSAQLGVDALAQKEIEKKLDAASRAAQEEKERILEKAKNEAEAMEFLVRPKLDRAADFIIERIVG